ncbi:MAG: FAD-binding oxidoreductase [Tissierellales bacterium]|nr:FAD-binding oxidoreductase [Tissierellales bacterium]
MNYNPLTEEIVKELESILGAKNVILDKEKMENYSHDETPEEYAHMPEVVITPTTTEQISEVMKLANKHLIPVTPRGAGSGLSGGAIPTFGGILLSDFLYHKIFLILLILLHQHYNLHL